MARHRRVRAGARLFADGQEDTTVANIVSGVVRLSRSLADGRTQIVALQFAPEFVGRPFAPESSVLTEAATDVVLCHFSKPLFESLLRAHDGMQELLIRRMAEELDRAREWMLLLGRKSAEERVASLILLCGEKARLGQCSSLRTTDGLRFDLPLSRTEIADFLGLTLETVGRMLRRLAEAGAIAVHLGRGISIIDAARLGEHAEREQG
jgi:CRP/FNR family transcriptional regulator